MKLLLLPDIRNIITTTLQNLFNATVCTQFKIFLNSSNIIELDVQFELKIQICIYKHVYSIRSMNFAFVYNINYLFAYQ